MKGIVDNIKKVLPEPIMKVLRQGKKRISKKRFKPYIKKKNVEGIAFDFWISDEAGRNWYDINCTDPVWPEIRFLKDNIVKQDDVILECGGHHGCTAIILSNIVGAKGKIITFEALPNNCDIIERNIKLNSIQNVTLERKAVGSENGNITLNDESNSSVAPSGQGVKVEMTYLDKYAYLNPTFIKIDVEGFEVQVLKGAKKILSKRPKFFIEVHTEQLSQYGASVEEIFKLLGVENYKLWIQWEDSEQPEEYDMSTPIVKRVHIYGVPIST